MATIPSFEDLLVAVRDGLGLASKTNLNKKRFKDFEMNLKGQTEMAAKLLNDIFEALDMDEQASRDALGNIMEWANFSQALELNVWTGNASEKQVLWHMLTYVYVPELARRLAFWSLAGTGARQPFDSGMPSEKFWFLPNWDVEHSKITLPVPQVIDWLLDLLGASSFQQFKDELGRKDIREKEGCDDSALRTLQNWRNGTSPQSAEIINQFFGDDTAFSFSGAFEPSMATIRQRFRIARMTQEGYKSLLKALCGNEVKPSCTDPAKNKLLQLLGLFSRVYNLTIEAWKNADSVEEQDVWFEARMTELEKTDLLMSITPSLKSTAYLKLADHLTRKFREMTPDSPLEDLVPIGESEGVAKAVMKRWLIGFKQEADEARDLEKLLDKARRSSPWRALEVETNYGVVYQFVQDEHISPNARAFALKRLRDLASTPSQTAEIINLELHFLLDGDTKQRPKDIQQRVQSLIDEAQVSQGYDVWKASLLRLRAKHWLMQNEFGKACVDFKAALEACSQRSFGGLKGDIARDGWAAEIAANGFIPNNQEVYYRNMLRYGVLPHGVTSIEDSAVWCDEFFWNDLYRPYPGFVRNKRLSQSEVDTALGETAGQSR